MKRALISFICLLAIYQQASAFTSVAPSGQTLYYQIVSGTAKVIPRFPSGPSYYFSENRPTGVLIIPSTVVYNGTTYDVTSIGENAFNGCTGLTSVTIPNSVTSIGHSAFLDCSGLNSVTIGNSVSSIDYLAFCGCSGLTSIDIPNSVTYIGDNAFNNCSGLASVTIPNSVTSIRNGTFENCRGLTSVTIPNSVTTIGSSAFKNCRGLTSVTIGDSVTTIGNEAFKDCSGLTSVTIGSSVTTIGSNAFSGCSHLSQVNYTGTISQWCNISFNGSYSYSYSNPLSYANHLYINGTELTDLIIPNEVLEIKPYSFSNCKGLTSVVIPNSVTSIGTGAFYYCSGLTSVTIGDSVTSIGNSAFYHCSGLTLLTIGDSVTTIGNEAFSYCSAVTSVTIPNSVISIGNYAFNDVRHIEYYGNATGGPWGAITMNGVVDGDFVFSDTQKDTLIAYIGNGGTVTIPSNVVAIRSQAFNCCIGLISVNIPNSVTLIDKYAFYRCRSLVSVTIGDSVTSIGHSAFSDCSSLASVTIPNSVVSIDSFAFSSCSGLTSMTIGNSVTSIGYDAFVSCNSLALVNYTGTIEQWCNISFDGFSRLLDSVNHFFVNGTELTDLVIPNGVLEIKPYSFAYYRGLTSVTIPNSVTSIGRGAFYGCNSLASVTIPNSVDTIDNFAFYSCSGLTSMTIGNSVTSIGYLAFYGCSGLTSVTIPNSVTSIGSSAFSGCSGLTSVIICDSVTQIPEYAFKNCTRLTAVTIGNSVTSIGHNAFDNCSSLTSVYFYSIVPPSFHGCFNYHRNSFFYVPCGTTSAYSNALPDSSIVSEAWTIVEMSANDTTMGIVNYIPNVCDTVFLVEATPVGMHRFVQWSDGNTDNPRVVHTSIDTSLVAIFDTLIYYDLTILSDSNIYGYCSGSGNLESHNPHSFSATPYYGYHFTMWNDGDTNNPRIITLTQDTSFTALFAKNSYNVTVNSSDPARGNVSGDTTMLYLDTVSVAATTNYGYHFTQWSDGNIDNPRVIILTRDTILTAMFAKNSYSITLAVDSSIHGSVTGAGTHEYLDDCTVSAIANYGYHFTVWNDGDTTNPRTITLTQDTTFTALFAKNTYTITAISNDTIKGMVAGNSSVEYLDSVTITAVPNYGYHFTAWNDGNASNPRTIEATRDSSFTAYFDYNQYSIILNVDTNIHGTIVGSGTYNYLSMPTITANANYGYHFTVWNDGDTTNPRTITLTQDTAFTALFAKNTYTITAISNDTIKGMVAGNSSVEYLDSVTITAMPNYGYHFTAWNDGNTTNPRTFEVTKDSLFTAYFDYNQYSITLNVDTNIHGTIVGSGTYNYLSMPTITANANYGYHFTVWNDGDTTNPRTITLTQDTVFTALFAKNSYNVTVVSADTIQGNVVGSTTTEYLDSVSIAATANYGYHFLHWNDGDTTNPRFITLTQDTLLTAYFAKNWYSVIGISDNETMGCVSGGDTVEYLDSVSLLATSIYGYHFSSWNDGDTNNPRVVCITQDTTFTALFANNQYTLTVQSNDETQGSVSNGGVFDYLDTVTIIASASEHYHFVRWDDGNTDNPREYVIVGDATLTAIFAIDTHTVTVTTNDIARGMVEATGSEFSYGTPCTVTATAYTGYVFSHWSNGITANPYTFAVLEDTELMAIFEEDGTQGIDDVAETDNIRIFTKYDRIHIDGLYGQDVTIYTIDGRTIASLPRATEHVAIPITTTGVYIVKIGNHPARKVVVIR